MAIAEGKRRKTVKLPTTRHAAPYAPPSGIKSLSQALDIITRPVFLKRGFAENRIITDWVKIVGEATAACSTPRRLTFAKDKNANGTLYIEVSNSAFATEMVYLETVILEKIACYFGYKAVSRFKILQNPQNTATAPTFAANKTLSAENTNALELSLAGIGDEELKASLRSLGNSVLLENT